MSVRPGLIAFAAECLRPAVTAAPDIEAKKAVNAQVVGDFSGRSLKMVIELSLAALLLLGGGFAVFSHIVRSDYLKKGKLSPASATLEFLFFAIHANSMYLFIPIEWPKLPPLSANALLYYCSLLLIIIGLAIVFGAWIQLGYGGTMGFRTVNLKISGLYKLSRNPQLIGYALFLIGFAVSYPSVYAVVWLIIFGMVAHRMVITEEEHLLRLYGEKYEDYCKNVPRYL